MMDLFSVFLHNSIFASVMILAVLAVRPLLRKAPRNICCLLWLLVALRLLLPFQLESPLSLQPDVFDEPAQITMIVETDPPLADLPVIDMPAQLPAELPVDSAAPFHWKTVLPLLWICGCLSLLIYSAVSYCVWKHRVWDAVMASDGAWESDRIEGAFLLGYFLPKIYIPIGLHQQDREFILAHERSHRSRGDHWWKLLGMLCLSLHWYNPLVWLSYALLCRDIETACDERVIRTMELEQRRAYSFALLNSGKRMSGFLAYPVAFGEISLKQRIKDVLSYRKPGIWVTLGAVVLAAVIVVCFMTTPANSEPVTVQTPPVGDVLPEDPVNSTTEVPTLPTTEPTQLSTLPTEPVTEPTAPTTEPTTPATEPATTKPEVIPTQPKPTEPKPTKPSVTLPQPTEPTVPPVTVPQPTEPTVPPVTTPQPTEPTIPPVIIPTEPPVTKPDQETIGGSCGDHAVWEYNDNTQQLKISGHGAMDIGSKPGWNAYSNRITSVVIGEGITSICTDAFSRCKNLRSVRLPYGLQTIGNYAFAWTDLRQVTIPSTVTQINCRAFCGCDALTRITFTGNPPKINRDAFSSVTANAYFPEQNGQWRFALSSYGGDLTWELCCINHSYINGVCERCGLARP